MASRIEASGRQVPAVQALLVAVAIVAAVFGLYGRFKGIGAWPFGADEYYLSKSVDNVLRYGLPQFPCGGYYTRGLLFQYAVAGLRKLGMLPEPAGRLLAGLCSLAVLPAAFALARRMAGNEAGWITLIMLLASIWEIEMARFARMYAPFQALFCWYVIFFLRYVGDRKAAALRWMLALSVLGVLTWEGGVLLGVANLLALVLVKKQERWRPADWLLLLGLVLLLALLYTATRDLRGFADLPGSQDAAGPEASDPLHLSLEWLSQLRRHALWAVLLMLPLAPLAASWRWLWSQRRQMLLFAGLCITAAAAIAHLFAVSGAVLVLLLLDRRIAWRELFVGRGRWYTAALTALLIYWVGFESATALAAPGTGLPRGMDDLIAFPDVYTNVVRPWGRTMPLAALALSAAFVYWGWRIIAHEVSPARTDAAALVMLVLVMMAAVGSGSVERIETRYTFFLYPLLLVLAVAAIVRLRRRRLPLAVAALLPLACFAASEDFQPAQVAHIDSADVNFRVGMSPARAAHYYPRDDVRSVASWLRTHVRAGDVVLTGIPHLAQYYPAIDYFFLDAGDSRYEAYVCRDGRTERWSNHAVLYGADAVAPLVAPGHRVVASVYPDEVQRLAQEAEAHGWTATWIGTHGPSGVLLIESGTMTGAVP